MSPIYIDYRRPIILPTDLPEPREDGYNGPVAHLDFIHAEEWNFEEWLSCYPVRSSNDKGLFGGFDQTDDIDQTDAIKPISLHAAHHEINFVLDLIDERGIESICLGQMHKWNKDVANALCSLIIPMFGYDGTEGATPTSWQRVFDTYFPQFDIVQLEEIKATIVDSDIGVDVWHNSGIIPGASWMSWVVSVYWQKSPSFSRSGRWVARPDYKA